MTPLGDGSSLDDVLTARPFTFDMPLAVERRLRLMARRIAAEERRAGVPAHERIDEIADFEHVLIAALDRGLEENEKDAGLQSRLDGRLQTRTTSAPARRAPDYLGPMSPSVWAWIRFALTLAVLALVAWALVIGWPA